MVHLSEALNPAPAKQIQKKPALRQVFFYLVGTRGFEPPTSCTPCKRSTRLNYVPMMYIIQNNKRHLVLLRKFRNACSTTTLRSLDL